MAKELGWLVCRKAESVQVAVAIGHEDCVGIEKSGRRVLGEASLDRRGGYLFGQLIHESTMGDETFLMLISGEMIYGD